MLIRSDGKWSCPSCSSPVQALLCWAISDWPERLWADITTIKEKARYMHTQRALQSTRINVIIGEWCQHQDIPATVWVIDASSHCTYAWHDSVDNGPYNSCAKVCKLTTISIAPKHSYSTTDKLEFELLQDCYWDTTWLSIASKQLVCYNNVSGVENDYIYHWNTADQANQAVLRFMHTNCSMQQDFHVKCSI